MFFELILFLATAFLTFIYFNGLYNENYWKKRGVKFYAKNKNMGPIWDYLTGDRALFEVLGELYKEYEKEPVVGIGSILTPSLFIRDATNMSHILQTDFNSFNHRGLENFEGDQLSENILFLNGLKWKLMRQNMTPLFTSTKLKQMYYILDISAQDFITYIKDDLSRQKGNAYDSLTNFCSAAITASVFGIGTESVFDSPFVKVARDATALDYITSIKFSLASLSTGLTKFLGIKVFTKHEKFFIGAIQQILDKREKENVKKHDFADIALSIQKNGTMRDESTGCEMEPTVGLLSAQAFFIFIAGVEPSASAFYSVLIELGVNPEILKNVHEEIDETFEKNGNTLNYEIITKMNYLEKVLSEGMRKLPPIGQVTRQCVKDTVLAVGYIKVAKGTKVIIPIFHVHYDPKFYPEPEKFDPERFTKAGQQPLSDAFYMPFGRGNRICIGARFARSQVKAGLVHLLRHFIVKTLNYDKLKFRREIVNVRPDNVDIQFIPRDIKA